MRRRQKLMATAVPVSPSALSYSRSSSKGLSSTVSRDTSWLVHSEPGTGTRPVPPSARAWGCQGRTTPVSSRWCCRGASGRFTPTSCSDVT
jgi:hypothetical protein